MRRMILTACSFVLVSWGTSALGATMITGVTIDDYSTQYSPGRAASLLVDGSGLSSDSVTFTADPTGPYHFAAGENRHWHTAQNNVVGAYVTFDLGSVQKFDEIRIWNHNWTGFTFRGFNGFTIETSLDGSTFTNLGSYSLSAASGLNDYTGELIAASATTQYVKFTVDSALPGNDGYIGLSEVQFFSFPIPAPEPSSLLLLSFGALGMVREVRRRQQKGQLPVSTSSTGDI